MNKLNLFEYITVYDTFILKCYVKVKKNCPFKLKNFIKIYRLIQGNLYLREFLICILKFASNALKYYTICMARDTIVSIFIIFSN